MGGRVRPAGGGGVGVGRRVGLVHRGRALVLLQAPTRTLTRWGSASRRRTRDEHRPGHHGLGDELRISFWNAYAVGLSWVETKHAGGWPRVHARQPTRTVVTQWTISRSSVKFCPYTAAKPFR